MLHLLDETLERFLRASVPLPERDVDVSFEAPDRDWSAGVNRPTVNLFLWDVRRNLAEQDAGVLVDRDEDGRTVRRPPLPRLDCRYLVTAWTTEVRDEHSLLGDVLQTLMLTPVLVAEHLTGAAADLRPLPTLRVGQPEGNDATDFWSALGGRLKPGLDLVVTTTLDVRPTWPAGPDVERYELEVLAADRARAGVEGTGPVRARERVAWGGDARPAPAPDPGS